MKWVLSECDQSAADSLAAGAVLPPIIARLLVNRGIREPAEASAFLECDLSSLSSPLIFEGMRRSVDRINQSITSHEKIVVYGDYDVDGVTGTALLYLVLRDLGALVEHYIPDRVSEGYGLNIGALEIIKKSGAGLVISVDCGISAIAEAKHARTLGLDLIVTDHHEISGSKESTGADNLVLPDALSILHPLLLAPDTPDSTRERISSLTGVGVAFKLAQALLGVDGPQERILEFLDLATLGTVADVGRLMGENRILVRHGLERLSGRDSAVRPGIAALKKIAGLGGKRITAGSVGFNLAPRINASGRLERADAAFELLTTDSPARADELATALDTVNRERQSVEENIQQQARQSCLDQDLSKTGAFVLASRDWHPGVIGIVASRIAEEFYRPAALISLKGGTGKGSARSIPGFDLYQGLSQCADLLTGFGGHRYAAGFTIPEDRIPEFQARFSSLVIQAMGREGFLRTQIVDMGISLHDLSMDLMADIEKLGPFGYGNPEPRFGLRCLEVVSSRIVGARHLKLRVKQGNGNTVDAVAFKRGNLLGNIVYNGARLAAVISPKVNSWNGCTAVELEIKDLKPDAR